MNDVTAQGTPQEAYHLRQRLSRKLAKQQRRLRQPRAVKQRVELGDYYIEDAAGIVLEHHVDPYELWDRLNPGVPRPTYPVIIPPDLTNVLHFPPVQAPPASEESVLQDGYYDMRVANRILAKYGLKLHVTRGQRRLAELGRIFAVDLRSGDIVGRHVRIAELEDRMESLPREFWFAKHIGPVLVDSGAAADRGA